MNSSKGQSQIITGVLLVMIMISLVAVTYFWGIPLIEKQKDTVTVSNAERFIKTLNEKIEDVAKNGGTQKITGFEIPGDLKLIDSENKFILNFKTTGDIIATGKDIYLIGDDRSEAHVGEEPGVILVRSDKVGNKYDVSMRLYYRNLTGAITNGKSNKYIIDIIGLGKTMISGSNHEITISEDASYTSEIETKDERIYITKIDVRLD
ncbi:MAG: hypothetical protein J7K87_02260 [Candidatus Aenigmarchaeota archaeon]|nr:hypothetical protein [Candidatus Aenigmarchaeota archaeon]